MANDFTRLLKAVGIRANDVIALGTLKTSDDGDYDLADARSTSGRRPRRFYNRVHRAKDAAATGGSDEWAARDAWFSPAVLSEDVLGTTSRKASDVVGVRCLWADLDLKAGGLESMDQARAIVRRLEKLLGARVAAVVATGGGVQPYWRLAVDGMTQWAGADDSGDARRATAALFKRWGRLVRLVVEAETNGAGSADSVWDLARVLRVPGTTNSKYDGGRTVELLRVRDGGEAETVSLEHVAAICEAAGIEEGAGDSVEIGPAVAPVDGWEWSSWPCRYADQMIDGWAVDEPAARHPWLLSQATRLAAARRLGYLTAEQWERGRERLWERFCELLERRGEERAAGAGDLEAFAWGLARAEAMDDERAMRELGGRDDAGHRHPAPGEVDDIDPFGKTSACLPPTTTSGGGSGGSMSEDLVNVGVDVASARVEGSADIDPSDKDDRIDPSAWDGGIFSDRWLAESFAWNVCRLRFCWASAFGWLEWSGQVWSRCPEERVTEAAGRWGRTKLAERVRAGDVDSAKYKGWKSMVSEKRQRDVVKLARGLTEVDGALFDADPDLLNCRNGVVDLRTGQVSEHRPEMLMMKITSCDYVAGARHEDWDRALETMPGDVRDWMQVRYGQAITGHMTPDDLLIVQNGSGSNGKSSVFGGMRALGGYYQILSDRTILADPKDHPTELMDLQGLRLALIEETPEARRLNVQRLKKITGTSEITARHIRKDSVTFDATHSLFLSTNYRPTVEETDDGTWRRLALVTFPYSYVGEDDPRLASGDLLDNGEPRYRVGDPNIRDRVKNGDGGRHEAALAWMVAGAMRWYAAGKRMPAVPEQVKADTREWRAESDVVLAYVGDRIAFDAQHHVAAGDLLLDFNAWLSNHGHKPWSLRLLKARFESCDEIRRRGVRQGRYRQDQKTGVGRLSRPATDSVWMHLSNLGNRYMAWDGIRFADDGSEARNSPREHAPDENPFV